MNFQKHEESHFVSASSVYFMKMFIEKRFTEKHPDTEVRKFTIKNGVMQVGDVVDQGFGRQGAI